MTIPQDNTFSFTPENMVKAEQIIARYPADHKKSAVMPLLDLAQRQEPKNYISVPAIEYIAKLLAMYPIEVCEIIYFYTMYSDKPQGRHLVQVCRTTPCWLNGSDQIAEACKKELGINFGETTGDSSFTLTWVECLGACINAPVVQINDDFHENLTPEKITELLQEMRKPQEEKPESENC